MRLARLDVLKLAAALVAAAALTACHASDHGDATPPAASNAPRDFSAFAAKAFQQPANSSPVAIPATSSATESQSKSPSPPAVVAPGSVPAMTAK